MDIPFPVNVSVNTHNPPYLILFDDGTTASTPLSQTGLIPPPLVALSPAQDAESLLLPFL
jgi:hypothetical protein